MRLTKPQTQEMLAMLADHFKVPVPSLRYRRTDWNTGGMYDPIKRRISTNGEESTVIHEFAHHLDRLSNKPRRSPLPRFAPHYPQRTRNAHHDAPFRFALVKVATAWYGDPAKYAWAREYKAVKAWWNQRAAPPSGEKEEK